MALDSDIWREAQRRAIRHEVGRRGIRFVLHFTPILNLGTIVSHGLLPRELLETTKFPAYPSAIRRLDGNDKAVSVSISAVNHRMFESKRRNYGPIPWVILFLDPSVLWTHECRFHRRNAASNRERDHPKCLCGAHGLMRMFTDDDGRHHDAPVRFAGTSYRSETGFPADLPTHSDAEVQVLGPVARDLIKAAWVERDDLVGVARAAMDQRGEPARPTLSQPFEPSSNGYDWWLAPSLG